MEKKSVKCPSCGSDNIRLKRSWGSVGFWGGLFVVALILSQTLKSGGDRLAAGLTALTVILGFFVAIFAALAKFGSNYCRDCQHGWRFELGMVAASTDPVAADVWAWQAIEVERQRRSLPTLEAEKRPPRFLATAAAHGLGAADAAALKVVDS